MRMQDSPIFGILRNLFLYFNPLLHSNWSSIVFALGPYASSFPLPFTRERSSHRAYIALHCVRKHQAKWMNKKKRNKSAILPHIRFASKMTRRMNLSLRNCSHQEKNLRRKKDVWLPHCGRTNGNLRQAMRKRQNEATMLVVCSVSGTVN